MNDLIEVFIVDLPFPPFIKQAVTLFQLLVFVAKHHDVYVCKVLGQTYEPLVVVVHHVEHAVRQERQTLHSDKSQRISVLLVRHAAESCL